MGIFSKLMNEFIDIIEWTDDSSDTMVWRFPRYQAEIKNGAQLTVRETQLAVLVDEGRFADVYKPGRYRLTTANMPILTTLRGWKYGFNSPFKVDVYFINTKQFINQKWGTSNPIMMRDPEFGPIRMRAFGSFNFRIEEDPIPFLKNIVGTNSDFDTQGISEQLRNFVITKFTDFLGESKIAALDLAANLNEFSAALTEGLKPDFAEYGIELTRFLVENISLPEAVEEALDRRTSMGVIGNMNTYTQMQFADSLKAGAESGGGGLASDAMGAGIGLAMAGKMAGDMVGGMGATAGSQQPTPTQAMASGAGATPPPLPQQPTYYYAINGVQQEPIGLAELQQKITQGEVVRDTMVWTAGMPAWAKAGEVASLTALFGMTPPPLP